MNKRYEVLDGLPTYGEMAIPITYNDELFVSEGYVVKFYKNDGTDWIANFQLGWTDTSKVISSNKSNIIFVVAGGIGYIINPDSIEPINFFDDWSKVPAQEEYDNAFKAQWELFLRHIVLDEPFKWNLLEGAKGVQLAELGLKSSDERRWLDIPEIK